MQLKHFIILLSILSIFLLYFLSTLTQPVRIEIEEIAQYEGKQVIVQGTIIDHRTTTYGGHIINIKNIDNENGSSLTVFVEEQISVEYGDTIQATGKVQKYNDEWEVVVNNAEFIDIIQKWNNVTFPLWQLAENPTRYEGFNVNVSGIIERVYDSYFYLIDIREEYTCAVYYDATRFYNISQSSEVIVEGRFVYDKETFRYIIDARDEAYTISTGGGK
jgi:RecG-like helicase